MHLQVWEDNLKLNPSMKILGIRMIFNRIYIDFSIIGIMIGKIITGINKILIDQRMKIRTMMKLKMKHQKQLFRIVKIKNQMQMKNSQMVKSELSEYEQEVVNLTNEEREKNGLEPLEIDKELSSVAREKSSDMQENNYFDHNSPTYGSPFDMMDQFQIDYTSAGENIAKGQP